MVTLAGLYLARDPVRFSTDRWETRLVVFIVSINGAEKDSAVECNNHNTD